MRQNHWEADSRFVNEESRQLYGTRQFITVFINDHLYFHQIILGSLCVNIRTYADVLVCKCVYGEHDVRKKLHMTAHLSRDKAPSNTKHEDKRLMWNAKCKPKVIVWKVSTHTVARFFIQTFCMSSLQILLWRRPCVAYIPFTNLVSQM
jgi:hypothetical protein